MTREIQYHFYNLTFKQKVTMVYRDIMRRNVPAKYLYINIDEY